MTGEVSQRTGLDVLTTSFSRAAPSGVELTIVAVSWVLPPSRMWTLPERSLRLAIKLRNGTCRKELFPISSAQNTECARE